MMREIKEKKWLTMKSDLELKKKNNTLQFEAFVSFEGCCFSCTIFILFQLLFAQFEKQILQSIARNKRHHSIHPHSLGTNRHQQS